MTTPDQTDAILDCAIIGGGVGGLATAWRLGQRRGLDGLALFEAGSRWGGLVLTGTHDGFVVEQGPDAVLSAKPAGLTLMKDLGLEDQVISTRPEARKGLIAKGTRLLPLPEGFQLLAPAKFWPFLWSPVMSLPGKLRMAWDLFLPARDPALPEESLAQFVRRRLGREALERLAQPLIGSVHSADPERLSLLAAFPQLIQMERNHRSLVLAMRASVRAHGTQGASGARYALFITLKGGLQVLTDRLVERLAGAELRLNTAVQRLERSADGWRLHLADGSVRRARRVALCLPAHAAARLLAEAAPALSTELAAIPYAGICTVALGCARSQLARLPEAAGFVVPSIERRLTMACTIASSKFAGRAPDDAVLLRAAVGGATGQQHQQLDNAALVAGVLADLRDLVGLSGTPRFIEVTRWPASLPQYELGHLQRVARIRAIEAAMPDLALIGNGYEGTGIPDVVGQGAVLAQRWA